MSVRSGGPHRILMLAPQPVLQPRGTPMSVYHRLRALSALGYSVDLVTYPLGESISVPNVRVLRVWRPWGLKQIKIGPSAPKLLLDAFVALRALACLLRRRYAAIHSHEEAVFIAAVYAKLFRIPHLYDMHSSLPQQLENWKQGYASAVRGLASHLERWAIRRSDVLITICPALADHVKAIIPTRPQVMIENVATLDAATGSQDVAALRRRYGVVENPLIVYTGNFEPYQGVELLLSSFAIVHRQVPQARLMIVGGTPEAIEHQRARLAKQGERLEESVVFAGTVPPEAVAGYLSAADVLVSPRVFGTNTPLKIYAYLKAGKPVVATNLATHTQVLMSQIAFLAPPEPVAFSTALIKVLTDHDAAARVAAAARALAEREFNDATYQARVAQAYWLLLGVKRQPSTERRLR